MTYEVRVQVSGADGKSFQEVEMAEGPRTVRHGAERIQWDETMRVDIEKIGGNSSEASITADMKGTSFLRT